MNKITILLCSTIVFIIVIILSHPWANDTTSIANHKEQKKSDGNSITNIIRKQAENGNPQAQSDLGLLYEKGHGVKKDYAKAIYWYNKSASQGYAVAE
ncbi:tetratricopeptide repeat protein, partial [Serratia marcescens]|uniref:tetratricopeptide repeat protein n=1 Tax=Serratia marcescens TaxID=615 RepID=UPI0011E88A46